MISPISLLFHAPPGGVFLHTDQRRMSYDHRNYGETPQNRHCPCGVLSPRNAEPSFHHRILLPSPKIFLLLHLLPLTAVESPVACSPYVIRQPLLLFLVRCLLRKKNTSVVSVPEHSLGLSINSATNGHTQMKSHSIAYIAPLRLFAETCCSVIVEQCIIFDL